MESYSKDARSVVAAFSVSRKHKLTCTRRRGATGRRLLNRPMEEAGPLTSAVSSASNSTRQLSAFKRKTPMRDCVSICLGTTHSRWEQANECSLKISIIYYQSGEKWVKITEREIENPAIEPWYIVQLRATKLKAHRKTNKHAFLSVERKPLFVFSDFILRNYHSRIPLIRIPRWFAFRSANHRDNFR